MYLVFSVIAVADIIYIYKSEFGFKNKNTNEIKNGGCNGGLASPSAS
jgi:hypothetical protein